MGAGVDVARSTGHPVGVFLALKEIRRARVRFGLLAGAVGLAGTTVALAHQAA